MGFSQAHRAAPDAADHLLQVQAAQIFARVLFHAEDRAVGQAAVKLPGHVGRYKHLADRAAKTLGQALAAIFRWTTKRGPAVVDELPVGLNEAGRCQDATVVGTADADAVTGFIGWCDDVLGESRALVEHAVDQFGVDVVATELAVMLFCAQHLVEHEAELTQGHLVLGHGRATD